MKYFHLKVAPMFVLLALFAGAIAGCSNGNFPGLREASLLGNSAGGDLSSRGRSAAGSPSAGQWLTSFDQAQQESQESGRPIMALFTGSDWCGPCIQLKRKVFAAPRFKSWAAQNVVLLKLDFPKTRTLPPEEKAQNQKLASRYGVKSYPTILFIDTDGRVKGKLGHDSDVKRWIKRAQAQLDS